jgi:shikimate kinase
MNVAKDSPHGIGPAVLLPPGKTQIHLTGFMGSGKSTVGRFLSRMLGWSFIDLDEAIAERAEKSVAQVFADEGEPVFRALEDALLLEVAMLARSDAGAGGCVVALGGGTLMSPANRDTCAEIATMVWLQCSGEVVRARCQEAPGTRPLWGTAEELEARMREREPGYRTADFVVDADGEPAEIAEKVLATIREASQGD